MAARDSAGFPRTVICLACKRVQHLDPATIPHASTPMTPIRMEDDPRYQDALADRDLAHVVVAVEVGYLAMSRAMEQCGLTEAQWRRLVDRLARSGVGIVGVTDEQIDDKEEGDPS